MKLVRKLLGKSEPAPTWDIKPVTERPAPRQSEQPAEDEVLQITPETDPFIQPAADETNPWLDDEMLDTIQLEVDDLSDSEFYQTATWEQDFENETRKLKSTQIGKTSKKDTTSDFNPYDTGSMRRGWKK